MAAGSAVASVEESCPHLQMALSRVLKPRHHLLSELQRRRIAEIFKGGSRLLKMPFPFLLVYASYERNACDDLGER